eukprot:g80767.t1
MPSNARRFYSAVIDSALASYALYSVSEVRMIKSLDDETLQARILKNELRGIDDESFGLSLYRAGHIRQARRVLWSAANSGSRLATRLLGDMYSVGLGGRKNNGLAISAWALAAHQAAALLPTTWLSICLRAGAVCVMQDGPRARFLLSPAQRTAQTLFTLLHTARAMGCAHSRTKAWPWLCTGGARV